MFDDVQIQSSSLFPHQEKSHTNKCRRGNIVGASEKDWMEWQAGYACGAILMPVGALIDTVRRFREDSRIPYSNLALESESGQRLIACVASAFQTSKDAARVRLLKKGVLADTGTRRTKELF